MKKPYLLVTGDFGRFGGMDWANHALATHLAEHDHPVHLVGFTASDDLTSRPNVHFHKVPKPLGSYFLGFSWLARAGARWGEKIASEGGRVVVNGGNCRFGDVNWVHYLHAAYEEKGRGPWDDWRATRFRAEERNALLQAGSIVTTAERNREDLVRLFGIRREKIHVIPLGTDPARFRPPTPAERAAVREELGIRGAGPVMGFVGALGDRRKGFDTLYAAWARLGPRIPGSSCLVVAGAGRELEFWRNRAQTEGLGERMKFLGFHRDVPRLLWACDAVIAPSRYEPYSLAAQEALASGAPCFLSRQAGMAERYPKELSGLLLDRPEDISELASRVEAWAKDPQSYRGKVAGFGERIRAYTWSRMAEEFVQWMETLEGAVKRGAVR